MRLFDFTYVGRNCKNCNIRFPVFLQFPPHTARDGRARANGKGHAHANFSLPVTTSSKMSTVAPSSISELATSLDSTLDMLQAALAKLQGPVDQPGSSSSPQRTELDAGRRLSDEFSSLTTDMPVEPALIDTPTIHEHLRRLYVYFCSAPASSETQNRDVGSRTPMLSTYGFTKLARAAQLIGERCSPVDVDLVFCKVEMLQP